MQMRSVFPGMAMLLIAFVLPVSAQNYVTGSNTGAETKIDNSPNNATFGLTVNGSGTFNLAGGIFSTKEGPSATGNITLQALSGGSLMPGCSITLPSSALTQQYRLNTFTFPSVPGCALPAPGSYTLVLSSDAAPQQNTAFFTKGAGATFVVTAGGPPPPTAPDLTVSKLATPASLTINQDVTYTIQVTNIGNGASSGTITVVDPLPAGLTFKSFGGTGWSCSGTTTQTCTNSTAVAAGGSAADLTITATVTAGAGTGATNDVTVSGGGETNTANDTFELISSVSSPDLTVSKTATPGAFLQGHTAVYTITVANIGTADSSGTITVTDTLPTGLTFQSFSGTGWSCSGTQTQTCTTSAVIAAAGTSAPLTITVNVASNAPTPVTNNLTVAGGGESNTSNDTFNLDSSVLPGTVPGVPVPPSIWLALIALALVGLYFGARRRLA
jgi:uncharacterized repeat protein (TIGR01451 family)